MQSKMMRADVACLLSHNVPGRKHILARAQCGYELIAGWNSRTYVGCVCVHLICMGFRWQHHRHQLAREESPRTNLRGTHWVFDLAAGQRDSAS